MGQILSTRRAQNKEGVIVETYLNSGEFQQLKGHLDNVNMFSENLSEVQTNISQRGKNYATKYFLIPRQYRQGFSFSRNVACQRIDSKENIIFIYTINKMQ